MKNDELVSSFETVEFIKIEDNTNLYIAKLANKEPFLNASSENASAIIRDAAQYCHAENAEKCSILIFSGLSKLSAQELGEQFLENKQESFFQSLKDGILYATYERDRTNGRNREHLQLDCFRFQNLPANNAVRCMNFSNTPEASNPVRAAQTEIAAQSMMRAAISKMQTERARAAAERQMESKVSLERELSATAAAAADAADAAAADAAAAAAAAAADAAAGM